MVGLREVAEYRSAGRPRDHTVEQGRHLQMLKASDQRAEQRASRDGTRDDIKQRLCAIQPDQCAGGNDQHGGPDQVKRRGQRRTQIGRPSQSTVSNYKQCEYERRQRRPRHLRRAPGLAAPQHDHHPETQGKREPLRIKRRQRIAMIGLQEGQHAQQ